MLRSFAVGSSQELASHPLKLRMVSSKRNKVNTFEHLAARTKQFQLVMLTLKTDMRFYNGAYTGGHLG